ncbi:MAG TPA: 3-phosphoshikimate 1-carboxyvinyltransferase [Solirubrobacterales bacterium]|nr:3-phosphoshikimate 1-carboxyvinyltransferase [Solirubrobacterales bacterium]
MTARFDPAGPLRGSLRPPSDKSISHRAALIAAMGEGETSVSGYLDAADTRSTLAAVRALGADVEEAASPSSGMARETRHAPGLALRIRGVGLRGPCPAAIDVGNAGTLLRLLPGWLAGQDGGEWTLDGDESIRRRPVDRIAVPLREMGADLAAREERLPPLTVRGAPLRGIEYELPVASAQVKSCVLLAGLLAEGETRVVELLPSRDHSERMLAAAGATVERSALGSAPNSAAGRGESAGGATVVSILPAERLEPGPIAVPADISSAAFFAVAALLVPGSEVVLEQVGVNPTRTGLLTVLARMGAEIELERRGEEGGEPTADLRVRPAALRGTEVGGAEVPLAIDELPLVALAACFAEGTTTIRDAAELRRKESDRVETVSAALNALGGEVEPTADGMVVTGRGGLRGGRIDSHGDHRIAMLGAVAGLASREGVEVAGMDAAAVSYPGFEEDLRALSW